MKLLRALGLLSVLASALPAQAVPITDTVIVGNQEWAQVDLFTNNSWNDLNAQCPLGVCSLASTINGYELSGWRWASIDAIQELFNLYTGQPTVAPGVIQERDSAWAPAFFSAGFRPTISNPGDGFRVEGWSSTPRNEFPDDQRAYIAGVFDATFVPSDQIESDNAYTDFDKRTMDESRSFVGAWLFRPSPINPPSPVPAPATLALFGLGMASLWITRRKLGAKV